MLIETLAMWLMLSVGVAILAWAMRSFPVAVVSSFGFVITGLQYFHDENDFFVLAMMIMIAFTFPMAIRSKGRR